LKAIEMLPDFMNDNSFTPQNLPDLEKKLFFEGERRWPKVPIWTLQCLKEKLV
jgi:hypothetical protein